MSRKIQICNQHKIEMGNREMFSQKFKLRKIKHEEVSQEFKIKRLLNRRKICEFFICLSVKNHCSIYLKQTLIRNISCYIFRLFWKFVHAIRWNSFFLYKSDVNYLLNDDFACFAYTDQSGGISIEHWVTDMLFTLKVSVILMYYIYIY